MNQRTHPDTNTWRTIEIFITASMGTLISITPIIVVESSFSFEVALILFFLNNLIVIDDWWVTIQSFKKYTSATSGIAAITIIYHNALILMTVWLLAAGRNLVPLSGYLLILFVISLLDIGWCQIALKTHPETERKDLLLVQAWKNSDVASTVIYLVGFLLLYCLQSAPLTCALTFCVLYAIRRTLDEITVRFFSGIV